MSNIKFNSEKCEHDAIGKLYWIKKVETEIGFIDCIEIRTVTADDDYARNGMSIEVIFKRKNKDGKYEFVTSHFFDYGTQMAFDLL